MNLSACDAALRCIGMWTEEKQQHTRIYWTSHMWRLHRELQVMAEGDALCNISTSKWKFAPNIPPQRIPAIHHVHLWHRKRPESLCDGGTQESVSSARWTEQGNNLSESVQVTLVEYGQFDASRLVDSKMLLLPGVFSRTATVTLFVCKHWASVLCVYQWTILRVREKSQKLMFSRGRVGRGGVEAQRR